MILGMNGKCFEWILIFFIVNFIIINDVLLKKFKIIIKNFRKEIDWFIN